MTTIRKAIIFIYQCIFLFAIAGCTPIAISEEQKRQIINSDADFQKILEIKNKADSEIADLRAKFLSEKNIYESNVAALRKDFETKRAQFYSDVEHIKVQLNPQREKISAEIAVLAEELKNKRKGLAAIKSMLNQAKAIIDGKFSSQLSDKDKSEWQKRFDSLIEEDSKVRQEIVLIKEKLYILKLKQRSLIQ
jgi:hypothetical protein